MKKKLLAIFLIACLTSSCFLTSCSKDTEAEPLEEAVEETMEEAVEETPETDEAADDDKQAEIATTPEQDSTKEWDISDEYEEEYPDGLYEETAETIDDDAYYTAHLTPEQIASERQLAQDLYDEGELDKAEYDEWIWELDHPGQQYPRQNNNTTSQAQSSQQTNYGIDQELPIEIDPFKDIDDGSFANVTFN